MVYVIISLQRSEQGNKMEKWDLYTKYHKNRRRIWQTAISSGRIVGTLDYFFCAVEAEKRDYSAVRKIRWSAKE